MNRLYKELITRGSSSIHQLNLKIGAGTGIAPGKSTFVPPHITSASINQREYFHTPGIAA